jgi:nitroimidazol reductase NimA-like FMN-containing flavoprotein (pyridoxamine 5'-phosphate oxidase superfamily)
MEVHMFGELRFKKRRLEDEKSVEILKNGEYGVLSTCGEDGQPYGIPLNYAYEDGKIYIHCATEGRKLDNIAANPRVCFTVTGKAQVLAKEFTSAYESVVAQGTASVTDDEEKLHAFRLIIEKYSPQFLEEGLAYVEKSGKHAKVVRIDILDLCGKHGH